MEFDGKVAIVTGAGKGIGAAAARAFAREGARVAVVDVDAEAASKLVAELKNAGREALAVVADVSMDADARRITEETVSAFGRVDVLVNNAGIQTYGTVESTSEESWERTISINLKSVFLVSKYSVPEIRKAGGGAIVNVSSVQAFATSPGNTAYAASKGGIVAMTRTMALDYARENIRVNCVCPGSIDTPMLRWAADIFNEEQPEVALQDWGSHHAIGRVGRAEEVAEVILFLASPRASFCVGAAYTVDGGLMASAM